MEATALETRLRQLEARDSIRTLVARYGIAVDDHDLRDIAGLFARDALFRSRDGVMEARGRDQIVSQFVARFSVLGISNHVSHDHIITLDEDDPQRARGLLTAHAELWRNGQAYVAALRYRDEYVVEESQWRFAERELAFLYYVPVAEYAEALGSPLRQRAYGDQRPADFPERLANWQDYRAGGGNTPTG
ncbi:MAG: nuclear transport factor 2 family protein [Haliea sp.]|uniref:nuclear transport factor 2 family protein n=1 Tax=Haliea sp. TaxID=1932666 RepID=UPI0032EAAF19